LSAAPHSAAAPRTCSIPGCTNVFRAKGLCSTHYNAAARATDRPDRAQCTVEDCTSPVEVRGLCNKHYQRWRKYGSVEVVKPRGRKYGETLNRKCSVEGCNRPHVGRGYCAPHLQRFKRNGDPGPAEIATPVDDYTRLPDACYLDGDDGTGLSIVAGCDLCGYTFGPVLTRPQAISLAWAHTLERHR